MKKPVFRLGATLGAVLLISICPAGTPTLAAETDKVANRARSGFSPEGLDAIQAMMDTAISDGRISAAIGMVARDGEIVWLGTAGQMEPGLAMRDDAILPLASIGKMFTATAAMILVEREDLSLDDPVSKYIPEFADIVVEVADESGATSFVEPEPPLTVFHLLTHTGGIRSEGDAFWATRSAHVGKTTTRDFARDLAKLPLQSQPGERFSYGVTGSSYVVVAAIIETISGQTLEEFMFENIFDPLGLGETFFYISEEKSPQLPAFYRRTDDGLQMERGLGEDYPRSTYFGSGGVMSSPQDILGFATIFANGGESRGVRILKAETIAMMMRDHLGDLASFQDPTMSWGIGGGVRMTNRLTGQARLQQYGWAGGNYAMLWVDPAQKLIGYFAFPLAPPADLGLLQQYQQMVYSALTASTSNP